MKTDGSLLLKLFCLCTFEESSLFFFLREKKTTSNALNCVDIMQLIFSNFSVLSVFAYLLALRRNNKALHLDRECIVVCCFL